MYSCSRSAVFKMQLVLTYKHGVEQNSPLHFIAWFSPDAIKHKHKIEQKEKSQTKDAAKRAT